jgi:hypothetical protein
MDRVCPLLHLQVLVHVCCQCLDSTNKKFFDPISHLKKESSIFFFLLYYDIVLFSVNWMTCSFRFLCLVGHPSTLPFLPLLAVLLPPPKKKSQTAHHATVEVDPTLLMERLSIRYSCTIQTSSISASFWSWRARIRRSPAVNGPP